MLLKLSDCSRSVQLIISRFLQLKPIPQVASWVACAKQVRQKGNMYDAAVILDSISRRFGKDVGRRAWKEFSSIDIHERGRGCGYALDAIRYGYAPAFVQGVLYTAIDERVTRCSIGEGWKTSVELFSVRKTGLRLTNIRVSSVSYRPVVAVERTLYFIEDDGTLSEIFSFEENIVGMAEGLPSGDILVMTAPRMAVMAPDCVILRNVERAPYAVPLSNIEQKLYGDCVSNGAGWVTCCGGMQNSEVRFLHPDGSWDTRFVHEKRVLRVARSENGVVSIDEDGHAYLWDGMQVVADKRIALDKLPKQVFDEVTSMDAGFDWARGRLYLSGKGKNIADSAGWCVSETDVTSNSFVHQLYPMGGGLAIALLRDSQFHFWDMDKNQVSPHWQLPESCATSEELRYLLDNRVRLSIEADPRLRQINI